MSTGFFVFQRKKQDFDDKNFNIDSIKLCVLQELLSSIEVVTNRQELMAHINQSEVLKTIKRELFCSFDALVTKKVGFVEQYKKISEGKYLSVDGRQLDIRALLRLEDDLARDIYSTVQLLSDDPYMASERLRAAIYELSLACIKELTIERFDLINDSEPVDPNRFAVDVQFNLDGNIWSVQTWGGKVNADCQTTVNDQYLEVYKPTINKALIDGVNSISSFIASNSIEAHLSKKTVRT